MGHDRVQGLFRPLRERGLNGRTVHPTHSWMVGMETPVIPRSVPCVHREGDRTTGTWYGCCNGVVRTGDDISDMRHPPPKSGKQNLIYIDSPQSPEKYHMLPRN